MGGFVHSCSGFLVGWCCVGQVGCGTLAALPSCGPGWQWWTSDTKKPLLCPCSRLLLSAWTAHRWPPGLAQATHMCKVYIYKPK